LVAALALFVAAEASADTCANRSACGQSTAWNTAFDTFDITVPGNVPTAYSHWRVEASRTTSDLQISLDQKESDNSVRGQLVMIGGRILATKGLTLDEGYEIDAVDGPLLYVQLLIRLLGRAFPEGPDSLHGVQPIKLTEPREDLQIATPSASGDFPAPWSVEGTASKDKRGAVHFDLRFVSTAPSDGKPSELTVRLKGYLERARSDLLIRDEMRLDGWKVYGVGPQVKRQDGGTIYDYGTARQDKRYTTVAEVRKAIAEEESPGVADRSKDFSGFWKENCKQGFGLRIKSASTSGMYAITFCGPGGCGNDGRNTFISGDKHYQVITQDEIRERSGSDWTTYHKCSPDPNAAPRQ
jgi:hypothetical protein